MAIAAVGDDVWAGGAGGALYHSANGGATWNSCQIFSNPNPSQVWAFWRYVWVNPEKGKHEVQVRATDANGRLQTSSKSGEWPDGATGYHTVSVEVV